MTELGLGGFDSKAAGKARAADLLLLLNNWINKLLKGLSSLDYKCQALMTSKVDKCLNDILSTTASKKCAFECLHAIKTISIWLSLFLVMSKKNWFPLIIKQFTP